MTREIVIDLVRRSLVLGEPVESDECFNLILEYSMECGKDESSTKQFLSMIHLYPNILELCLSEALEYYKKKFEVVILYEQKGYVMKVIAVY